MSNTSNYHIKMMSGSVHEITSDQFYSITSAKLQRNLIMVSTVKGDVGINVNSIVEITPAPDRRREVELAYARSMHTSLARVQAGRESAVTKNETMTSEPEESYAPKPIKNLVLTPEMIESHACMESWDKHD